MYIFTYIYIEVFNNYIYVQKNIAYATYKIIFKN